MAITKIPAAGFTGNNFRNIIINGDMSIAQRGTSFAGNTTGGYTVDRWNTILTTAGTYTISQDTDVPTGQGFAKSLKYDCTTADASLSASDNLRLQGKFEGQNLQYLKKGTSSAESLTLSFWVKSNKTGTYIVELDDKDNATRRISRAYTIDVADTWEKKTVTYPGDTTGGNFDNDNNRSLDLMFWLAAGSNFTTGTLNTNWSAPATADRAVGQVNLSDSTSNYINITGVQLEAGTTASDFEFLPYDVNLERCSRYFYRHVSEVSYNPMFMAAMYTTTVAFGSYKFHKPMRAIPTFSSSGTFSTVANSSVINCTFTVEAASTNSITIKPSLSSGRTGGQAVLVRAQGDDDAHIQFDSEL